MNISPRGFTLKPFPMTSTIREYLVRMVQNSNWVLTAAQIALYIFCFGANAGTAPLFIGLAAVFTILQFRDLYMHRAFGAAEEEPWHRHYLNQMADAIFCLISMLVCQVLAFKYSPKLMLPFEVLYRGAVVFLPLNAMLRLVLRPKPKQQPPFRRSRRSALHLYWRTCVLNALWLLSFYALILQDVTDDPHSKLDPLRGFLPLVTFGNLIVFGRNGLLRRCMLMSIFTNLETQRMTRLKETLLQSLKRGEPFYWASVVLQFMVFAELAVSMGAALWPWVSGQSPDGSILRVVAHLVAFGTAVLTWQYIKAANAVAAEALQLEIDLAALEAVPVYWNGNGPQEA